MFYVHKVLKLNDDVPFYGLPQNTYCKLKQARIIKVCLLRAIKTVKSNVHNLMFQN